MAMRDQDCAYLECIEESEEKCVYECKKKASGKVLTFTYRAR